MSSGLYRRQPHMEQIDCSDDWWEVVNTDTEADGGPCIIALAETETMALGIELIPDMKEALRQALTSLDLHNAETPENSRYGHLWNVLDKLKALE